MYMALAKRFRNDEEGATATEYALLVVAIALIMVVGAVVLGNALKDKFSSTGDCIGQTPTQCANP
jgi:Flp pilus assembly pilin Flp